MSLLSTTRHYLAGAVLVGGLAPSAVVAVAAIVGKQACRGRHTCNAVIDTATNVFFFSQLPLYAVAIGTAVVLDPESMLG